MLNRKAKELCNRGSIRGKTDGTPFTRLCGNDDICLTRDTRSLRSSFFSLSLSPPPFPPRFHSPAVTTTPLGPSRSIPICGLRLMVQASVRVAPRASALSYLFVAFVTAGPFKPFSIVVFGGENRRPAGRPRLSFSLLLGWEGERKRPFPEKCLTLERNKIKRCSPPTTAFLRVADPRRETSGSVDDWI